MVKNYSKEIRQTLNNLLTVVDVQLKDVIGAIEYLAGNNDIRYEACIETIKNSTEINQITEMLKLYGFITEYDQKRLEIIKTSIYVQAFTDFYVMNRFINKIEKNDSDFPKVTYEMIEKEYFRDPSIYVVMLKCMEEFNNLSAYNKILAIKNLTLEEFEMLKSINPFFEQEKNIYDIEITKELIITQMDKWNNRFNLDKSLEETIKFIFRVYNLNNSNINKLFEELEVKGIENSKDENEVIIFNGSFITKEALSSKLEEEYQSKQKVKK